MSDRYTVQVGDGQCALFIRDGQDSSAYCMPPTATREDAELLARRLNERELPTFSKFEARMREINEEHLAKVVAYCTNCSRTVSFYGAYPLYNDTAVANHRALGHVVIERPKEKQ